MSQIVQQVGIPTTYSITIAGSEVLTVTSKRKLIALSLGGGLDTEPTASIDMFEPIPAAFPISLAGPWEILVNGALLFRGYAETPNKARYWGGNVFTFPLRSVLTTWDVELTNTTFGVANTTAGEEFTPDHICTTVGDYLNYLITTVQSMGGAPFYGTIPSSTMLFANLYDKGVLSVSSTTYLAEIKRVCQSLGYYIFSDPIGTIRIIWALAPYNPANLIFTGSDETHFLKEVNAGYATGFASIPSTVLLADDKLGIGVAYGHQPSAGITADDTNFGITGINNLAFAVTVGMKKEALPTIAKQIFDVARKASGNLTFSTAEIFTAQQILGYFISWTDSQEGIGYYTIKSYQVTIDVTHILTEVRAYISPSA